MNYLNTLWSKWMPETSPRVAIDAHPRLAGVMDTINATDAHGPATKLPREFYDKKGRAVMDEMASDECIRDIRRAMSSDDSVSVVSWLML